MAHKRIVSDASGALENLHVAVRLREAHDSFELSLLLDDDRGGVAAVLAQEICQRESDPASRRAALDRVGSADAAIGENPLLNFATMDIATKATVRDLAMLAQTLVFRSWAEMRRAVMDFDILHHAYSFEAPLDKLVPQAVSRRTSDGSILIWAPHEPVERLYIPFTAAVETARTVRAVCKPGNLAHLPVEIVPLAEAANALSTAAVCVAASLSDPGPAIALARWKIPLCATFTSGAYEWIDSVASYRSWSVRSAALAMTQAIAAQPAQLAQSFPAHVSSASMAKHDALVTIVVRSQSSSISRATAESIAGQSHTAHERIIVRSSQSLREAVSAANGLYVLFMQDGDVLFRDGLAALVNALENSGGIVAYGDALLGYLEDGPGPPAVIGYSVVERTPVWSRTLAAHDEFAGTYFRVLFRRDALTQAQLRDDLDALLVYDVFCRTLLETTAVRADEVCGISYRYLDGRMPGGTGGRLLGEYEKVYSQMPAADAAVAAARTAVQQYLQSRAQIALRPPPQRFDPPKPFL